jgi:hypothetical protein
MSLQVGIIQQAQAVPANMEEASDEISTSDASTDTGLGVSTGSTPAPCIVENETKAVNKSKILVYFSLLVAAAVMAASTYFFMSLGEQDDFQSEVRSSILTLC